MSAIEAEFVPPPEAPVFEPTTEEFKDPLAYIAKIRPIAEQSGICKIKPPPEWQPPFAVDVDNFKFTPRMQRLNELEATTRIKLNFLDQIAKFWELQGSPVKTYLRGSSLKIPNVERKALDLFTLYRVVQEEGGMEVVSRERKWSKIATRMGYPPGRGVGSLLRQHYERILYPYDVFQSGASLGDLNINDESDDSDKKDNDYIPHGIPSRQAIKPPADRYARRSKRHAKESSENLDGIDYSTNNELRKLQFYGAGPKMPGYLQGKYEYEEDSKHFTKEQIESLREGSKDGRMFGAHLKDSKMGFVEAARLGALLKRKERPKGKTPIDQIVCSICGRGDEEASMLLCDGCDDSYHTFCLIPPLSEIPKGDWRCPRCVAEEVCKPQEAFGFEQAQREYTLQEFGEKADQFKQDYFNMPVHRVPYSIVEKEFWRIVNAVDEDVTVEYGADLHTIEHGSGFPNKKTKSILPGEEEYVESGWNLNNLPVLEGSVLKHINADISGMKIPWTYVGMCFATFCWHNEDHWSYSINYLHWGEPKTWYGVPGGRAESFEDAMRSVAPELFQSQPDLLHQLVTIMNPNLLISQGVPICRTNQLAGEFVVTFPRSYHAGFNQGYNFAEAVNFAPADWLPIGRVCVAHYGMLHRFCVFSHDELVCKMASDPDRLDISIAASTYQDMLRMVEAEKDLRKSLLEWGVTEAEREAFELLPDDERQCDYCKTTCFLSAVTCSCDGSRLVCLTHKEKLCVCPPEKHCLRYRYTLDELPVMLHRLKVRAESFDNWAIKVRNALASPENGKLDISEFKELAQEAEEKRFPKVDLYQTVVSTVEEGEKCAALAQQLLSRKVRTRNRQSGECKQPSRLTLDDLQLFHQQLSTLACDIKESLHVKDLLDRVLKFKSDAKDILVEEMPDSKRLEKLLDVSLGYDVDLPEVPQLRQKLQQTRWLEEVRNSLIDPSEVTLEVLRKLLDKGVNLPPHPTVEKAMAELQELLTVGERWEEKAKVCLQARPKHSLPALESILSEAGNIPVHLPNVLLLKDAVKKAKDWSSKVDLVQNREHYPYLDILEYLVTKGRPVPVRLEQLPQVESQVDAAKTWRERTARTFLKKNSSYTLVEVLSPRKDIGLNPVVKGKKKKNKETEEKEREDSPCVEIKFEEAKDPASIVAAFKQAEKQEIEAVHELRLKNLKKRLEDNGEARYCVCHKPMNNSMLQCELCKDWYHINCIPLPKSASLKKQQQAGLSPSALAHFAKELKFLCPLCLRSRRPRLETILSLLVSLQKLPVRLPEGEALQCLTERAMSWQDRARQALATEELAAALAKLSVISQRMVEQAAREKTEKIISTELMKAASNPELQPHLHSVAQSAFSGLHGRCSEEGNRLEESHKWSSVHENASTTVPGAESAEDAIPGVAAVQEIPSSDPTIAMDVETTGDHDTSVFRVTDDRVTDNLDVAANYSLEHAYSTASKSTVGATPRKHARKSPLVPRQLESPVLQLSDAAKCQLEELMMEGDLLEVSLDETQHIWRILQATKLGRDTFSSSPFSDTEENDSTLKVKSEKKKIKKRKVEDGKDVNKIKLTKKKVKLSLGGKDGLKSKKKKLKLNKDPESQQSSSKDASANSPGCTCIDTDSGKHKKSVKGKFDIKDIKKEAGVVIKKEIKDSSGKPFKLKSKVVDKHTQKKLKRCASKSGGKSERKDGDGLSDNEPDDLCSAASCVRPTGEAVNWVQCDAGCEQWFHLLCVGLSLADISENEDYICPNCRNKRDGKLDMSCTPEIKKEKPDYDTSCEKVFWPSVSNSDYRLPNIHNSPPLKSPLHISEKILETEQRNVSQSISYSQFMCPRPVITSGIASMPSPFLHNSVDTNTVPHGSMEVNDEKSQSSSLSMV